MQTVNIEQAWQLFMKEVRCPFKDLVKKRLKRQRLSAPECDDPETLTNYFEQTVLPHKVEVYKAGMQLKDFFSVDPTLRLIVHDWSKFTQPEWAYAFYNFKGENTEEAKENFQAAWHHHKLNNSHHPEHWISIDRAGENPIPMPMPKDDIVEMVADWIGAGITYGTPIEEWLTDKKVAKGKGNIATFLFHPKTIKLLHPLLERTTKIEFKPEGNRLLVK